MKTDEVKDIYNTAIQKVFHGDYEHHRWFHSALARADYDATKRSIYFHVLDRKPTFHDYLELGQGAGTWTAEFIAYNPRASFDAVDISKEMIALAKEKLGESARIRYFEGSFLDFDPDKKYDLFFSSRVIEYIPDVDAVVKKIASLLKPGGKGFIITKTPKYLRNKLLLRETSGLHKGQISPATLKNALEKNGFRDIAIYPVTMHFPLFRSAMINKLLYAIFYRCKLDPLSKFFAESYCVRFFKP
ncbi:class I SAM-dependent methyltransferase [Candidatus Azambacteria bacterium]|nr:class I SAM-dependent methyltransferase [Candidatus Azambacteria bacterium]